MTNLDTVRELQQRLRELPSELEKFFQHILYSTERIYYKQAARLYLVRLVAEKAPSVIDVSMFCENNMDFALEDEHVSTAQFRLPTFHATTQARIVVRCQDLL